MKTIFRSATCLWLTCLSVTLYAQEPRQHTLGNLWEQVERQYPGIQAQTALVASSASKQQAVKSQALPQFKIQAQNSYGTFEGSNGAFFPQSGFFNVSGNPNLLDGSDQTFNTFGSATVEWEVFAFGKQNQENKAASAQYEQQLAQKEAYILQLKKELAVRHIQNLYATANYDWMSKNADRLKNIELITNGLAVSGLKPAADNLLAHSSYLQAAGQQRYWTGNKQATHIALAELVGEPLDTIDAIHLHNFLTFPLHKTNDATATETFEHPVLTQYKQEASYFEHSSKSMSRAALPSIKVLGGYAIRGTGIQSHTVTDKWKDGFSNAIDNYLVGVGITWNFSSLFTNQYKKQALTKQAESAEKKYSAYEQALQANIAASQVQIKEQTQQLQQTHQAIIHATQAYGMYMARYKSGLITLSELLQIQQLLEQAEKTHIDATQHYWMQVVSEAALTANFDFLFTNL
ncbi:TolC family protein [Myroides sp. 1354]|uniref:TolC family protein n=1 Tax=unclassified Myroides TaxID=2642485 RepID=UPI002577D27C|nr:MULTISPECIES: TolC family protein [unclassified Myroides]MDM1045726.1 TolC family protein [Myroides sp. R163-1]MDM1056728.1 TolC family protein [Myroides sp. 1354]MDM1070520.1 TolC family protein [Myroides sp. 1372]